MNDLTTKDTKSTKKDIFGMSVIRFRDVFLRFIVKWAVGFWKRFIRNAWRKSLENEAFHWNLPKSINHTTGSLSFRVFRAFRG